ncbi:uncharacterized protein LOC115876804 isoform X2 [Sitophilus oryzae]|uniref:Uncharacterized protein LOC115876804 isoform X2 n=1 Tax=Sitophilus oryzae TaxID=7048 RepID=A0A6J2XCD7_SITOR|nr:uncharacterized protein LOC115876804 isoform X2 [Sitophilus oryzae]
MYRFIFIYFMFSRSVESIVVNKISDSAENHLELNGSDVESKKTLNFGDKKITILVEDDYDSLYGAFNMVKQISDSPNYKQTNFSLITFNSSGVSLDDGKNLDVIEITDILKTRADENKLKKGPSGSPIFFALLQTSQSASENSAILIFVNNFDKLDATIGKYALKKLLHKNITVHALIYNEESVGYEILKDIVVSTGGRILKTSEYQNKENIVSNIFGYKTSDIYPTQTLKIEVGLGSELITLPAKQSEVYFKITNTGSSVQYVNFFCSDTKYILLRLSEYKRQLQPQESTTVTLYLSTKIGTYQDEIVFSAKSGSQVYQKRILVNVGSQISDQNPPELNYRYTSDCTGVLFSECNKGMWSVEISARDPESGLLNLNSSPEGLYFSTQYTSGTKETVTGYYSESCCNPDLYVVAVDRMNNRKSYSLNAYNTLWSAGAIAALVLGIIFFLIIVGVATYFIVMRVKSKDSYDLPRYRGGNI